MLALLLSLAAAAQSAEVERATEICGPSLASSAGGSLSGIDVVASTVRDGWTVIRGNLIVLRGMGPAPSNTARTNHVIRTVHTYICWVRGGRVQKQELAPSM